MRTRTMFLCIAMAAGIGCYRNTTSTPASTRQELKLENALASARNGERGPWTMQGLYVESLGGGGVRVTHGQKWDARIPVRGVSNAWITGKVKSKFAADSRVKATEINVDTDENGLVSLRGHVDNADMAARAIEDALNIQGVNAVDCYLTF